MRQQCRAGAARAPSILDGVGMQTGGPEDGRPSEAIILSFLTIGVLMKRSLAVSLLFLCSLASAQESEDLIRRREAWFYAQRAYPLGYIPSGARVKAIEEMERMTGRRPLTLAAGSRV